jgi:Protein of unknown function (DUF4199)
MRKIVLTFGLLSGGLSALLMIATVPFMDRIGFDRGELFGYTAIVLSFLFVFFGVRAYRDQSDGTLTFGRGAAVGLLITVISCLCYVATWEVLYFKWLPGFADKYATYAVEKVRASGASATEVTATVQQMQDFKRMYDNPWINAAMTFMEPFPIGVLVTVVSAAVLRRRQARPGATA